jgi:hypothetical protein
MDENLKCFKPGLNVISDLISDGTDGFQLFVLRPRYFLGIGKGPVQSPGNTGENRTLIFNGFIAYGYDIIL